MNANREDVVQAALLIEHWCVVHHRPYGECDCPLVDLAGATGCMAVNGHKPCEWDLEEKLRKRGMRK